MHAPWYLMADRPGLRTFCAWHQIDARVLAWSKACLVFMMLVHHFNTWTTEPICNRKVAVPWHTFSHTIGFLLLMSASKLAHAFVCLPTDLPN